MSILSHLDAHNLLRLAFPASPAQLWLLPLYVMLPTGFGTSRPAPFLNIRQYMNCPSGCR